MRLGMELADGQEVDWGYRPTGKLLPGHGVGRVAMLQFDYSQWCEAHHCHHQIIP